MGTPLRRLVRNNREELQSLARSLNKGASSLLVGPYATEPKVKAALLTAFQVVPFATHDLVARKLAGFSKPALVMTHRLKERK